MRCAPPGLRQGFVALLAEGVDRNKKVDLEYKEAEVALLAEGVDRNNDYRFVTEYSV